MATIRINEEKSRIHQDINNLMRMCVDTRYSVSDQMELARDQLFPALSAQYKEKYAALDYYSKIRAFYFGKEVSDLIAPYNIDFDFDRTFGLIIPSWETVPVKVLDLSSYAEIDLADYAQYYLTAYQDSGLLVDYAEDKLAYSVPKIDNYKIIAEVYSSNQSYVFGESVNYAGGYYYCVEPTTGVFDSDKWLYYNGEILKGTPEYQVTLPANTQGTISIEINNVLVANVAGGNIFNVSGDYFNEDLSSYSESKKILELTFNVIPSIEYFTVKYVTQDKVSVTGDKPNYYYFPVVDYSDAHFYTDTETLTSEDVSWTSSGDIINITLLTNKGKNTNLYIELDSKEEVDIITPSYIYKYNNINRCKGLKVVFKDTDNLLHNAIVIENNQVVWTDTSLVTNVTYSDFFLSFRITQLAMDTFEYLIYDYDLVEDKTEWDEDYKEVPFTLEEYDFGTKLLNLTGMSSDTTRPKWQSLYPVRDVDDHTIKAVLFVTMTHLESVEGWRFYLFRATEPTTWETLTSEPDSFFKMSTSQMESQLNISLGDDDISKSLTEVSTYYEPEKNPFFPLLGSNTFFEAENTTSPFRGNYASITYQNVVEYMVNSDIRWRWGVKPAGTVGQTVTSANRDTFITENIPTGYGKISSLNAALGFSSSKSLSGSGGNLIVKNSLIYNRTTSSQGGTVDTLISCWWNDLVSVLPQFNILRANLGNMNISPTNTVDSTVLAADNSFYASIQDIITKFDAFLNYNSSFLASFPRSSFTYSRNAFDTLISALSGVQVLLDNNYARIQAIMDSYIATVYEYADRATNREASALRRVIGLLSDLVNLYELIQNKRVLYDRY